VARTFTLDEARALLPEVRALAEAMQADKRGFDEQRGLLRRAGEQSAGNGHGPSGSLAASGEAERRVQAIQQSMQRLTELGVEVKGIEDGLVDFPSLREGRLVYLCWRVGEPDILYWHELDAGFRGRQAL